MHQYAELLEVGLDNGYVFQPVRTHLGAGTDPDRVVVLRHDVDRKPENALKMAYIEAERGIRSTYYFRTIDKTFRPDLIAAIEAFDHEIGYHYEDLDRAAGDVEAAHRSFERHLGQLRDVCTIDTICMHGNPLTPHDNRDMWLEADGDLDATMAEYDLIGDAYLTMDFEDVTYFSDTGRTWRDGPLKVKDHTMGEGAKCVQVDTTRELCDVLRTGQVDKAYLLVHPNRWADSYTELVAERTKDSAINVVKHGINIVS